MSTDANSDQAWVWLARIRKPQGRKGEVLADLMTDFPEKFKERTAVWLFHADPSSDSILPASARQANLLDSFLHKGGIVLRFSDVDSISAAESLRGMVVAIPRDQRTPLAEDEVYIADLIGCSLVDITALPERIVGVIEGVDRDAGPVSLLVVRAEGFKEEILIPFAKAYLKSINLEARRVEMSLPEGLIDVQAAGN